MDAQLRELLQGGVDGELQRLLQSLARDMEQDPEGVRAASEAAAREIGGDVVGGIQALAQAVGAGGAGGGGGIGEGRAGAGGRIRVGDRVRIRADVETNRRLSQGHGGWNPAMADVCGATGQCTRIDNDGDVHVRFDNGQSYCWNPESVESMDTAGFDTSWHAGLNTPPPYAPWRLECYRLKYAAELAALKDRGFPEVVPGIRALMQHGGDVDMAAAMIESAQVAAHAARSPATAATPALEEQETEADLDSDEISRVAVAMSQEEGKEREVQPEPQSAPEVDAKLDSPPSQEMDDPALDRPAWLVGLTVSPGDPAPRPLCDAVLAGDLHTLERYLEEPGSCAHLWFVSEDVPEPECFSLLAVAAIEGHVELCRILADDNIDEIMRGATALQLAAWAGQLDAVKVLHACGARVDFVSMEKPAGTSVRSYRVSGAGSSEVNGTYRPITLPTYSGAQPYSNGTITMFRWHRQFWALSDLGAGRDNFDQIGWLYSCEANGETPPMAGWTTFCGTQPPPDITEITTRTESPSHPAVGRMGTPLWLAATAGHAEVCKWLLLNGAPVESVGPQGDTALKVAERNATRALCSAVFEGAKFWAGASLREAKEILEADGEVRHDVVCDRSGVEIVGALYHLRGFNYDLCEAEYIKLSDADKEKYECIMRPPKLLFDSNLRQLCESQQRTDLCDYIGLRDESLRVRACQRLAWATNLISQADCIVVELDIDTVSRVAMWTSRLTRSSASFNLKVIQEESLTSGVSSINLKRLRSVERQLMPGGSSEIHDLLETAGLTRPDTVTTLLDAVQTVARDQRPLLEGVYKCTQRNGVAIRNDPKEGKKTTTGPSFGDVIAVETVLRVQAEAEGRADPLQVIEKDVTAALSQLRTLLDEDTVRGMMQDMQSLSPSEQLGRLLAMGFPLELPSASPSPVHEVEYLKLVGGGYCPMKLPGDNNPYFQRLGGFVESGDPMDSPALAVCASRTVAQGEQLDGLTLCEWRRFQRFAVVWPGRPERLSSTLPVEISSLSAFLASAKLDEYTAQLSALGLELGDCPFISMDDLAVAIPKEFHRKRLRRLAQRLPLEPARAASEEDVVHLTNSTTASVERSHHLLGNTAADNCFQADVEKFRRIRQLADGNSDEIEAERRRRGKFCGRFSRGSARAEMNKARESPLWDRTLRGPLDVRAKIDALWAGERDLATLQRGLSADGARLMELILNADDDLWDEEVARKLHDDEPLNAGEGSAQRFFDKNIVHLTRIRQLADPERAMSVQPRFNQAGYEDERHLVRTHYVPVWKQIGWDLEKPIERLWQGERKLEVLSRGCDANTAQLVALLLAADDNTDEANRRHNEEHDRRRGPPAVRAERLFEREKVKFRRIRQLADPETALHLHPRFNQDGVEAERQEVRSHIIPAWAAMGWNVGPAIERLWSGERDLEALRAGCDRAESRLMELILEAHMPQHAPNGNRTPRDDDGAGHSGEWRGEQYEQWCSAPGREEGPLCTHLHRTGILKKEHWSCCGVTDRRSNCPLATGTAAGSATGSAQDCPGRHGLTDNNTPRAGYGCDVCHRDLREGARVHSCRRCNHDVCHECFVAGNRAQSGTQRDSVSGGTGSTGGSTFHTAVVGQLVEHKRRKAQLLGFRCDRRGGLNGDTANGCRNADGACRLRYHDTGEKLNVMCHELTFFELGGEGGAASPAEALGTVIADDDPVVLQLVSCGFLASQAKFAMARGREQGIRGSHMAEACMDFILENPTAGVPPRRQGAGLVCPAGHVLNPIPDARYDTVCDVCHSHEIHHICTGAKRHYDVCASCYQTALGSSTASTSTTGDNPEPTIAIEETPPPRNPAASDGLVSQQRAASTERDSSVSEGVPPSAATLAPAPTPGVAASTQEDRHAAMRAARLARFG